MSITDPERVEIFSRIGQLEGARGNETAHIKSDNNGRDTDKGGGAKAFASILAIIAIIGGMAAIITPMRQQMEFITTEVKEVQKLSLEHTKDGHPERMDAKVEIVKEMIESHYVSAERHIAHINQLGQDVAVLTQQMNSRTTDRYYAKDAARDKEILETKIDNLKTEIKDLKEFIKDAYIHTHNN